MTNKKYKLVPVEPTAEMVEAAREHHEGEPYLPASLYKAMLAAAPAVQGEPVAGWPLHPSQVRTLRRSVKRYDCTSGGSSHCYGCYTMTETENGEYVSAEDYEALQAKRQILESELATVKKVAYRNVELLERNEAETERAIQRAAEVLPHGYRIEIEVEKDAGSVALFSPGAVVECDFQGGIAEQISDAIDAALADHRKGEAP